jgi:DNA-binding CsgD family transcriptional regulator
VPADVELGPLDADSSRAVCDDAAALDELTRELVLHVASGRPGVLVPLARANRKREPDAPLRLPAPLVRDLATRFRRLDPLQRDVMTWMAVLGTRVTTGDLARLTGRTPDGLAAIFDSLIAAGVVSEVPGPGGVRYAFCDGLTGELAKQECPPSERRRRNAAVLAARRAAGDGPSLLVPFAVGSAEPREVIGLSLRAAVAAREAGELAHALNHATRAVEWSAAEGEDDTRLSAELERGFALAGLGDWSAATEILTSVVREQRARGNTGGAVLATKEWSRMRFFAGDYAEAISLLSPVALDDSFHGPERAEAIAQMALFAMQSGQHSEAIGWYHRALDEAAAVGDELMLVRSLGGLGTAEICATGSPDGLERITESYRRAMAANYPREAAVALNNQTLALNVLGFPAQAVEVAKRGLDLVSERGIPELDTPLNQALGEAFFASGRLREARAATLRARAAAEGLGLELDIPDGMLAWLDGAVGDVEAGLEKLRVLDDETDLGGRIIEHIAQIAAAHIHLARFTGKDDEARTVARRAIALWHETEDRADSIGLLGAAVCVLPPDETGEIQAVLRECATAGARFAAALCDYAAAHHADTPEAAAAAFRQASEAFAAAQIDWWAAVALLEAGEAAGAEGADDLQAARIMFRELEAPGWRARCEASLRAIGKRFVAPSRNAGDALSAREFDVLRELAKGLSTREIGTRLFITEKTVEKHLGKVFAKLGVSSRAAAIAVAYDRGLLVAQDRTEAAESAESSAPV